MTRTVRSVFQGLTAVIVLNLVSGCESGTDGLAPVRGKVSYKGVPLSTGTIVFTPDALRGTTGSMARSEIRPDGTYVLQTNSLPGATVGWHRVTVMAMESRPESGPDKDLIMPRSLLPEKYRDPELSGLSCQVRSRQENCIDFDLD
jgi:hypothetical protein